MEAFLKVCGELRVVNVVAVIAAIVFMAKILQSVNTYFQGKWELEKEKKEKFKEVLEYVEKYPEWHQQSIDIRNGLADSIGGLKEKMEEMNDSMSELKRTSCEGLALTWRYRILRFDDEIRHDIRHTKEHFDQILDDITKYNRYCNDHEEFPNDKAVFAIENIKRVYQQCTEEGTFL